MSSRADLIREIEQIAEQYKREVPGGRRQWPVAIKERVKRLLEDGATIKEAAAASGLSYATVHGWTRERKDEDGSFRELTALPAPIASEREITTSRKITTTRKTAKTALLTIITPKGYRIEGVAAADLAKILGDLA